VACCSGRSIASGGSEPYVTAVAATLACCSDRPCRRRWCRVRDRTSWCRHDREKPCGGRAVPDRSHARLPPLRPGPALRSPPLVADHRSAGGWVGCTTGPWGCVDGRSRLGGTPVSGRDRHCRVPARLSGGPVPTSTGLDGRPVRSADRAPRGKLSTGSTSTSSLPVRDPSTVRSTPSRWTTFPPVPGGTNSPRAGWHAHALRASTAGSRYWRSSQSDLPAGCRSRAIGTTGRRAGTRQRRSRRERACPQAGNGRARNPRTL
jgi:hypothetical protein